MEHEMSVKISLCSDYIETILKKKKKKNTTKNK